MAKKNSVLKKWHVSNDFTPVKLKRNSLELIMKFNVVRLNNCISYVHPDIDGIALIYSLIESVWEHVDGRIASEQVKGKI